LYRNDAGISVTTSALDIANNEEFDLIVAVERETESSDGMISIYVNKTLAGSQVITAASPVSIEPSSNLYNGSLLQLVTSNITSRLDVFYNRALTSDQVAALPDDDVDEADQWGSQTPIYESDFSVGVDGWSGNAAGATLTGNTDGINGSDDWLKVERTGATGRLDISKTAVLAAGKNNGVTLTIYNDAASVIQYFQVRTGATGDGIGEGLYGNMCKALAVPPGTEVTGIKLPFTAQEMETALYIFPCDANGVPWTVIATGTIYYVKAVNTYQIGATGCWTPKTIRLDKWWDASTNNLDAAYPAAGSTANVDLYFTSEGTETCDASNKVEQVLTPSATGVFVEWQEEDSGFNPNDPDNFTYEVLIDLDDPNRITGLVLDEEVLMEEGEIYACRFRRADTNNTSQVLSIVTSPGTTNQLTLAAQVPQDSGPEVGDLAMFGEADRETVECLVK
jgi:hypothetical protein